MARLKLTRIICWYRYAISDYVTTTDTRTLVPSRTLVHSHAVFFFFFSASRPPVAFTKRLSASALFPPPPDQIVAQFSSRRMCVKYRYRSSMARALASTKLTITREVCGRCARCASGGTRQVVPHIRFFSRIYRGTADIARTFRLTRTFCAARGPRGRSRANR